MSHIIIHKDKTHTYQINQKKQAEWYESSWDENMLGAVIEVLRRSEHDTCIDAMLRGGWIFRFTIFGVFRDCQDFGLDVDDDVDNDYGGDDDGLVCLRDF